MVEKTTIVAIAKLRDTIVEEGTTESCFKLSFGKNLGSSRFFQVQKLKH
jgi:hypothetical protein